MVTYCACCGERLSVSKREAPRRESGERRFLCSACRAEGLSELKVLADQAPEDEAPDPSEAGDR